jgi:hypothetical protein
VKSNSGRERKYNIVARVSLSRDGCSLSPNIYKEGLHLPLLSSSFTIIEEELKRRL